MSKLYLAALLLPAVACAQSQPAQHETSKTPDETFVISANHFPQAKAGISAGRSGHGPADPEYAGQDPGGCA